MVRILIGFLIWASCGSLHAAPLAYFVLEGRIFGSNDPFAGNVEVQLGDTVEYRLLVSMASERTLNQHLDNRPDGFRPHKHGFNSLSISILQDSADPIQADLNSPVLFTADRFVPGDGWGRGLDASPGTLSARPDQMWNDLLAIRPIHWPGVFTAWEEEIVFTGLLNVASVSGPSGKVAAEWGPVSGGGGLYGYRFFPTPTREQGSDPLTHFTPLTLTASSFEAVPEPSTVALLGTALVGLALLMRRGRFTHGRW